MQGGYKALDVCVCCWCVCEGQSRPDQIDVRGETNQRGWRQYFFDDIGVVQPAVYAVKY